jgi:hypothetical protein
LRQGDCLLRGQQRGLEEAGVSIREGEIAYFEKATGSSEVQRRRKVINRRERAVLRRTKPVAGVWC